MVKKFEIRTEAELFIHNDLSNCASLLRNTVQNKIDAKDTDGLYQHLMSALVFTAFAFEARVNFVGWKLKQDNWVERSPFREKIDLLNNELGLGLSWGKRPLQTFKKLETFRNTLAHGKPERVDDTQIVDIRPEVWDALKSQWESTVTHEFMELCHVDSDTIWLLMLNAAGIPKSETLTHGGHSLIRAWKDANAE